MSDITISPGSVVVEAISGIVRPEYALYYITLEGKHAVAECVCENPIIISVRPDPKTHVGPVKSTLIEISGGGHAEAGVSRYTLQVLVVADPDPDLLLPIPFTLKEAS